MQSRACADGSTQNKAPLPEPSVLIDEFVVIVPPNIIYTTHHKHTARGEALTAVAWLESHARAHLACCPPRIVNNGRRSVVSLGAGTAQACIKCGMAGTLRGGDDMT